MDIFKSANAKVKDKLIRNRIVKPEYVLDEYTLTVENAEKNKITGTINNTVFQLLKDVKIEAKKGYTIEWLYSFDNSAILEYASL